MKRILLLLGTAVLAAVLLSSCTKEPSTSSIQGKWKFNKEVAQLLSGDKVVSEEVLYASSELIDFYFEFNADKTYTTLGVFLDEGSMASTGTYAVFDNKLVLTSSSSSETFIIDSVSSSELVLITSNGISDEGVGYTYVVKWYFNKIK